MSHRTYKSIKLTTSYSHIRGPLIIASATLAIVGLAIMGFTESVGARYFGVFLTCAGANTNIPQAMTFQANNIRGQWKRAFCSATLVGFGGIGGIAGSLVFRSQDAPEYHPGLYACIAASLLIIVVVLVLDTKFYFDNKKQASGNLVIEGGGGEVRPSPKNTRMYLLTCVVARLPLYLLK